jgi:hypothetical protein
MPPGAISGLCMFFCDGFEFCALIPGAQNSEIRDKLGYYNQQMFNKISYFHIILFFYKMF